MNGSKRMYMSVGPFFFFTYHFLKTATTRTSTSPSVPQPCVQPAHCEAGLTSSLKKYSYSLPSAWAPSGHLCYRTAHRPAGCWTPLVGPPARGRAVVRTARAGAGLEPAGSCSTVGKGKGRAKGAASADRKTAAWHMFTCSRGPTTRYVVARSSPRKQVPGPRLALQEREPDGGGPQHPPRHRGAQDPHPRSSPPPPPPPSSPSS